MLSQRDPSRWGLQIGVMGINVVVAVLLSLNDRAPGLRVIGVLLLLVSVTGLVLAIRGFRRERRVD